MSAEGPVPLVLVHGQLMTDAVWARLLPLLPAPPALVADVASDDSIAAMAERLLADAPARFDLVGFAMGGFVAFEVMRRAPERVRRLVLIATLAEADGPAQRARRQGYADLVEAGEFDRVAEERIPILTAGGADADPGLLAAVRSMLADTGAATFLRQQRAILDRPDSTASLARIACPTLIVRGEMDGITSEVQYRTMFDMIPGARGETIADCGHLVPLECPGELAKLLANWLYT